MLNDLNPLLNITAFHITAIKLRIKTTESDLLTDPKTKE